MLDEIAAKTNPNDNRTFQEIVLAHHYRLPNGRYDLDKVVENFASQQHIVDRIAYLRTEQAEKVEHRRKQKAESKRRRREAKRAADNGRQVATPLATSGRRSGS